MKRVFFILCTVLALSACQKVLFDQSMPLGASLITACPQELNGSFFSLNYTDSTVGGQVYRIDRVSDFEIVIYSQYHMFIDSAYLAKHNWNKVDSAWFEGQSIHVINGQRHKNFELDEAIKSQEEKPEYYLNWRENQYSGPFEDTTQFKVLFADGSYFLNVEKAQSLFHVSQLTFEGQNLRVKNIDFLPNDSINPTQEFIDKYGLKTIKEEHGKFYVINYRASLNNAEFTELSKEAVFESFIWYRLKSKYPITYFIMAMVAASALLLFVYGQWKR